MEHSNTGQREIVLLGAGHTNAHVLRMWRMQPIPAARLTCINDFPVATYSGMLPGVLAGQYPPERMTIDLVRLCAAAGARLICGRVEKVDCRQRLIHMAHRPALPFDILSIGIGSRPRDVDKVGSSPALLPIKPMQSFLSRLHQRLQACLDADHWTRPLRVVIVGGGVAGVEIACCLPYAIRRLAGNIEVRVCIVEAERELATGTSAGTRRLVRRELERRGIQMVVGQRVVGVTDRDVQLSGGDVLSADLIVWATGAEPSPLLACIDARRDERGFLFIRPTLQTLDHDHVFAVGDCATLFDAPTAKAGVYAVRQGPVLWENLQRMIAGRSLVPYRPQKNFLKLVNLGDGRAVGEYHGWAFSGRWCWRLKDRIDSRFMDKYQDYSMPMVERNGSVRPQRASTGSNTMPVMRCLGCGGKVGSRVLSRVLSQLDIPPHRQVLLGLDHPDDAAVIRSDNGTPLTVTVDFFAPPLDDAYLAGRLAALNAASDCYAMGSRPFAALASVTLPYGTARQQERLLYELLLGALEEFRHMGATLVGGHTIEGPQLTVGFTVLADQVGTMSMTKKGLQGGDYLLLTKPLGTGVLLAAHRRAMCRYDWYETLLDWMLRSNQADGEWAVEVGIRALTDVTGFGLAGHLAEMLRASQLSAEIHLDRLPLLPGVRELILQGVESTLAPENRYWEYMVSALDSLRGRPEYQVLFDPQTSGGLLIAVPAAQVAACQERWQATYGRPPWWIGRVVSTDDVTPTIRVFEHAGNMPGCVISRTA